MKAIARNIRISPKKLAVIASIVRNRKADDALALLKFMPKKGADVLYKVLASAVANASHNDSQDQSTLTIASLVINKGIVYKRANPVSRGRSHAILKRTSNITIELSSF